MPAAVTKACGGRRPPCNQHLGPIHGDSARKNGEKQTDEEFSASLRRLKIGDVRTEVRIGSVVRSFYGVRDREAPDVTALFAVLKLQGSRCAIRSKAVFAHRYWK